MGILSLFRKKEVDLQPPTPPRQTARPKRKRKTVTKIVLPHPHTLAQRRKERQDPPSENTPTVDHGLHLEPHHHTPEIMSHDEIEQAIKTIKDKKERAMQQQESQQEKPIASQLVTQPTPPQKEEIQTLIDAAHLSLLNFDLDDAKKIYTEIMQAYHALDDQKKKEYYDAIHQLYKERKTAERVSSHSEL